VSALGVALAASLALFGWSLSVARDPSRGGLDLPATADPSAVGTVEPVRRGDADLTGAFVIGPDGASQSGWAFDGSILDAIDDYASDCLPHSEQRRDVVAPVHRWGAGASSPSPPCHCARPGLRSGLRRLEERVDRAIRRLGRREEDLIDRGMGEGCTSTTGSITQPL